MESTNRHVIYPYHIEVQGEVSEDELNITGSLEMNLLHADNLASLLTIPTDQLGLVELIRHLHSRGFELLSMTREP